MSKAKGVVQGPRVVPHGPEEVVTRPGICQFDSSSCSGLSDTSDEGGPGESALG